MITAVQRNAILARLIAAGGPWVATAVYLGVFETITPNGLNTNIASITVPPGGMATRQAVTTWSASHIMNDGRAAVDSPSKEFRPASSAEATALQGWYLADAATAGNLIAWGTFPQTINLADETRAAFVVARLAVPPLGGEWAEAIAMNG